MCWLFPGKLIRIDTVCPDCGERIVVEMRDGDVILAPDGTERLGELELCVSDGLGLDDCKPELAIGSENHDDSR